MTSASKETSSNVFMVFGQTGNGKSTLIKLFCGKNAPSDIIGHGTNSKTKDTSFFNENDKNNNLKRIWIDTMGTSDSSENISNQDILRKVMAKMYSKYSDGFGVKVIWIVKQDRRKSRDLQIEAQFINSLSEYSTSNIWDSTIIIVKQSKLNPKNNVNGALSAAADYYTNTIFDKNNNKLANIDNIGYTMLSVLDDDDDTLESINDGEFPDKLRIKQGYLWDREIKEKISSLLNNKLFINVIFKKKNCLKCGIIGDPRFVPTSCHKQFEKKHGIFIDNLKEQYNDNIYIHTGQKQFRHPKGETLVSIHDSHSNNDYLHTGSKLLRHKNGESFIWEHKSNVHVHTGEKKWRHPKYERKIWIHKSNEHHHTGDTAFRHPSWCKLTDTHPGRIDKVLHASDDTKEKCFGQEVSYYTTKWRCPKCGGNCDKRIVTKGSYKCYNCKDKMRVNSTIIQCGTCPAKKYKDMFCTGCASEYQDPTYRDIYKKVHSCCEKEYYSTDYCKLGWTCCDSDVNDNGCKEMYSCCRKLKDSYDTKGCEEYWTCCQQAKNGARKCRYKECNCTVGSSGCEEIYSHCGNPTNSEGCEEYWTCCGQAVTGAKECRYKECNCTVGSSGCQEKYSCCKKSRESKGCETYWSCCNQLEYSKGCSYKCCKNTIGSPGCKEIYNQCRKDKNSQGCEEYYTCCKQTVENGKPCAYACCKKNIINGTIGCKKVCKQCSQLYGKGPGCCNHNVKHKYDSN